MILAIGRLAHQAALGKRCKAVEVDADTRLSHGCDGHTRNSALIAFLIGKLCKMRRVLALVLLVLLSLQSLRVAAAPYCDLTSHEHASGKEQAHHHAPASAADADVDSDEAADNAAPGHSHTQLHDVCCAHGLAALLTSQVQPNTVSTGVVFDMPRSVSGMSSPASVRPERPQWHVSRTPV